VPADEHFRGLVPVGAACQASNALSQGYGASVELEAGLPVEYGGQRLADLRCFGFYFVFLLLLLLASV